MSTFVARLVPCPACGAEREHEVATSINAARSPKHRDAILAGQFQVLRCEACGHAFTYLGEFVYMDLGRRQMIGVFPSDRERSWPRCERQTVDAYEENLGRSAPAIARPFGEGVVVRCVFGLGALREKLVASDAGFDDVVVEAAKLDLFRTVAGLTLSLGRRPRLVEAGADEVAFAVPPAPADPDRRPSRLPIDRAVFDELLAAVSGDERVAALGAGAYVDLGRILMTPEEDLATHT